MRHSSFLGLIGLVALAIGVYFAIPMVASPMGTDHVANVASCKDGGWQALARSESPSVSIRNQDDCISNLARGETLVQLEAPRINVTMQWLGLGLCAPIVEALFFPPDSQLRVVENSRNTDGTADQSGPVSLQADENGALSFYGAFPGPSDIGNSYEVTIGGVSSGWVPIDCGR